MWAAWVTFAVLVESWTHVYLYAIKIFLIFSRCFFEQLKSEHTTGCATSKRKITCDLRPIADYMTAKRTTTWSQVARQVNEWPIYPCEYVTMFVLVPFLFFSTAQIWRGIKRNFDLYKETKDGVVFRHNLEALRHIERKAVFPS